MTEQHITIDLTKCIFDLSPEDREKLLNGHKVILAVIPADTIVDAVITDDVAASAPIDWN